MANEQDKLRAGYGKLETRTQEDVQTEAGRIAEKLVTAFQWVDPFSRPEGANLVQWRQGVFTFMGYMNVKDVEGYRVPVRSHAVVTLIIPPGGLEEDKVRAPALVTSIARFLGADPKGIELRHGPLAAKQEIITPTADVKNPMMVSATFAVDNDWTCKVHR